MVLKPLEFSECISDSPWFRHNLHQHECSLEKAYKQIKQSAPKVYRFRMHLETKEPHDPAANGS